MLSNEALNPGANAPWLATLKRGSVYLLADLTFEKGKPIPVSDEVRDHLETYAVEQRLRFLDPETDESEIDTICAFIFEPNPKAGAQQ